MRLWIGLHLPRLPLEVFVPSWSTDPGCVVLEQERVLAVSDLAHAAGVRIGLRRGGVLMLLPEARIHEREARREDEARQAVALALLQYTPLVAEAGDATLLMDVGASLRLFGGILALCRRVRANVADLGFTASLGCAPTAHGAWLLARAGAGRVVRMAGLEQRLDALAVSLLPAARPYAAWFDGIGCATLGDLRRLPRPGLQRRCGRGLLDLLDAAYGLAPELFEWIVPPETFHARIELFDRIENADLLLEGGRRLLLQLTGWLCGKQLAAERITLRLEHERGREARPATTVDIVLAKPTWQGGHILRLMKERLGKVELVAPVIGLALEVAQLQPMAPPSESLFVEPGGTQEDQVRMLELLVARLGADNVLQPVPVADYRPEVANGWVSIQQKVREADVTARLPPSLNLAMRPTWLLAKPIALLIRDHRPFYRSPLRMVSGPERVEAGWWSGAVSRDYFIAEGQDHALYYVYRERISGAGEGGDPKWFLHGLFG